MKIINEGFVSFYNKDGFGWVVDMWDVESGDEVGWVSGERFGWEKDGKKYSGVVKDESGIWEVYGIEEVEVLS